MKVEVGQWYKDSYNNILKCVYISRRERDAVPCLLEYKDGRNMWYSLHPHDLKHLPECTGFDWEPPKPVVAPNGWRLLTEGETIELGDMYLRANEWVVFEKADSTTVVNDNFNLEVHRPIARKIEPKYRPFKNAEEFRPHRDKWNKFKQSDSRRTLKCTSYSDEGVNIALSFLCYEQAFISLVFEDGTPFGVEVTE